MRSAQGRRGWRSARSRRTRQGRHRPAGHARAPGATRRRSTRRRPRPPRSHHRPRNDGRHTCDEHRTDAADDDIPHRHVRREPGPQAVGPDASTQECHPSDRQPARDRPTDHEDRRGEGRPGRRGNAGEGGDLAGQRDRDRGNSPARRRGPPAHVPRPRGSWRAAHRPCRPARRDGGRPRPPRRCDGRDRAEDGLPREGEHEERHCPDQPDGRPDGGERRGPGSSATVPTGSRVSKPIAARAVPTGPEARVAGPATPSTIEAAPTGRRTSAGSTPKTDRIRSSPRVAVGDPSATMSRDR